MAKVLLVEDDNNLREIYEARLQAEGYDIVSAQDGETALVVAKKEQPDLIISDVMMPRISGFEMLDILRNTEGLKDVKVIMLTALGQAEDKTRADSLGANKYLVKSQVTLEDIVKAAAELLGNPAAQPPAAPPTPMTQVTSAAPVAVATPSPIPVTSIPITAPPNTPVAAVPSPTPIVPVAAPPAPITPPVSPAPAPIVPTPAPAAVPAPPTVLPPAAPAIPTPPATADQQLVTDAVKDLVSGTPGSPPVAVSTQPPAQPAPLPPAVPTAPPAAAPDPPAPAPVALPVQPPSTPVPNTDDSVVKKKIIQPLDPGVNQMQPDINELLVKEGHTFDNSPPHTATIPHAPGHVISPNPVGPTGQPVDPNTISL